VLSRIVGARVSKRYRVPAQLSTDDNGFLVALPARVSIPDAEWASFLTVGSFDEDMLAGLRSSYLLRQHFRYVANTGLLVLRRAGGATLRRGALAWNSQKIFDRLWEADRDFPLVRETMRVVTRDLMDAPGARAYLEGLAAEPRVLHPAAASPFTFGIVTSSFGDSVVMDDRASMVEALHERVLAVLGETPADEIDVLAAMSNGDASLAKRAMWQDAVQDDGLERPVQAIADADGQPMLLAVPNATRKRAERVRT